MDCETCIDKGFKIYVPLVSLANLAIVCMHQLLRWKHLWVTSSVRGALQILKYDTLLTMFNWQKTPMASTADRDAAEKLKNKGK